MKPDGTVVIDTKIKTDGAQVGIEEIKNTLGKVTDTIDSYNKSVQEYVDNYVANMEAATKSNNEFQREIETLKKNLEDLEGKGLYFGDEEYDDAYLKLKKVEQALKDYKKELVSPTPDANILDGSTLEGQIERLTSKLAKLRERGKGFGDSEFDSTAQALKRAEQALSEYKNELFKTDAQREKEAESARKQAEQQAKLNQKLEEAKQKEAAAESARLAEIGQNAKISNPLVVKLREEIERLTLRQKDLKKAGLGPGYEEYDTVTATIKKLNAELTRYTTGTKKAGKETKKLNTGLKNTEKSSRGARMGIGRMLATSILFSTVFRAISMVTAGLKEGMDNLAQYSDDTNQALSILMSAMTQLKNAFATAFSPLIEFVAPALAQFINLLSQAVTWTAQLLAALTGKDTFVKAVKVQQDYAESLDKTKDETEEAADATEKSLAPFDQLIQLTQKKKDKDKDKNELKPEDMFVTEEVSNGIKVQADTIKETFGQLFTPLKQSWEENGPQVLSSVKNLFSAIKQLAGDVGASFMQVWNAEGYGKAITDDLLVTFSNLVDTVANLITNFDKAWVSGGTGTSILRHLGDIILEITGFFRAASESLKEWSADLDFTPLLRSFDNVLIAIRPLVSDVGDVLLWLLNEVLLPIATWGVEQALPEAFNLIAAALRVVHSVLEALKPLGVWLWDNFLKPLGQWTGSVIIAALKKITECLERFSGWISENQSVVQNGAITVAAFFAAWKITEMLSFIQQSGGVIKAIENITKAVAGSTLAKIKDSAETAYLNALYAKDFLTNIAKATSEVVKHTAQFIKSTAAKWAEVAAQKALTLATQAWNGICSAARAATTFFSSSMGTLALQIGAVLVVFKAIYELASMVSKAWDKMTPDERVATKIIAVAGAIALVVAAAAAFMHDYATLAIAGSIAAIAGLSIAGISSGASSRSTSYSRSGYSLDTYSVVPYKMPRLATGTVVPPRAGEFAAILGDNKRETEVVSPLSTMKQAFKEALFESGIGAGERDINIELVLDGQRFARAVYKANNQEKQRVGVRMVTNG